MSQVADLVATLRADTSQFVSGMQQAGSAVGGLSSAASDSNALRSFTTHLDEMAVAAGGGLVDALKSAASTTNQFDQAIEASNISFQGFGASVSQAKQLTQGGIDFGAQFGINPQQVEKSQQLLIGLVGSYADTKENLTKLAGAAATAQQPLATVTDQVARIANVFAASGGTQGAFLGLSLVSQNIESYTAVAKAKADAMGGASAGKVFQDLTDGLHGSSTAAHEYAQTLSGLKSSFSTLKNQDIAAAFTPLYEGEKKALAAANDLLQSPGVKAFAAEVATDLEKLGPQFDKIIGFFQKLATTTLTSSNLKSFVGDIKEIGGPLVTLAQGMGQLAAAAISALPIMGQVFGVIAAPLGALVTLAGDLLKVAAAFTPVSDAIAVFIALYAGIKLWEGAATIFRTVAGAARGMGMAIKDNGVTQSKQIFTGAGGGMKGAGAAGGAFLHSTTEKTAAAYKDAANAQTLATEASVKYDAAVAETAAATTAATEAEKQYGMALISADGKGQAAANNLIVASKDRVAAATLAEAEAEKVLAGARATSLKVQETAGVSKSIEGAAARSVTGAGETAVVGAGAAEGGMFAAAGAGLAGMATALLPMAALIGGVTLALTNMAAAATKLKTAADAIVSGIVGKYDQNTFLGLTNTANDLKKQAAIDQSKISSVNPTPITDPITTVDQLISGDHIKVGSRLDKIREALTRHGTSSDTASANSKAEAAKADQLNAQIAGVHRLSQSIFGDQSGAHLDQIYQKAIGENIDLATAGKTAEDQLNALFSITAPATFGAGGPDDPTSLASFQSQVTRQQLDSSGKTGNMSYTFSPDMYQKAITESSLAKSQGFDTSQVDNTINRLKPYVGKTMETTQNLQDQLKVSGEKQRNTDNAHALAQAQRSVGVAAQAVANSEYDLQKAYFAVTQAEGALQSAEFSYGQALLKSNEAVVQQRDAVQQMNDALAGHIDKYSTLNSTLDQLLPNQMALGRSIVEQANQLQQLDNAYTTLNNAYTLASERVAILNDQYAIAQQRTAILNDQYAIAKDSAAQLNDQYQIASDRVAILNDQYAIAQERTTLLSDQYQIASDHVTLLNDQYAIAQSVLTQANDQYQIASDKVTQLNDIYSIAQARVQGLTDSYQIQQDTLTQLTDKVRAFQDISNRPLAGTSAFAKQVEDNKLAQDALNAKINDAELAGANTRSQQIINMENQLDVLKHIGTQIQLNQDQTLGKQQFNITQAQKPPEVSYADALTAATQVGALNVQVAANKLALDQQKPAIDAAKAALDQQKPAIDAAKLSLALLKPALDAVKASIDLLKPGIDAAKASLLLLKPAIDAGKLSTDLLKPAIDAAKLSLGLLKPAIDASKLSIDLLKPAIDAAKLSTDLLKPAVDQAKLSLDLMKPAVDAAKLSMDALSQVITPQITALGQLEKSNQNVATSQNSLRTSARSLTSAQHGVADAHHAVELATYAVNNAQNAYLNSMFAVQRQEATISQQRIQDMLTQGQILNQVLSSLTQDFATITSAVGGAEAEVAQFTSQLNAMFANVNAANTPSVGNPLGGLGILLSPGGPIGGIGIQGFFGGTGTPPPAAAEGGLISKEGLFHGAEGNRPELILPLTDQARSLQLLSAHAPGLIGGKTSASPSPPSASFGSHGMGGLNIHEGAVQVSIQGIPGAGDVADEVHSAVHDAFNQILDAVGAR